MGWSAGQLERPFSARAAIAFALGEEFAERIVATLRYGTLIYAAVRSADGAEVFGLLLLAERRGGILYAKPISEERGPAEDGCPARILDLLSEPANEAARQWRARCRARLAHPRPRPGQKVAFATPLRFFDGAEHRVLTYLGGSRFRSREGALYSVPNWSRLDYALRI